MAKKDAKLLGADIDINPLTERLCRVCDKRLRKNRYFTCDSHPAKDYWDLEDRYVFHEN